MNAENIKYFEMSFKTPAVVVLLILFIILVIITAILVSLGNKVQQLTITASIFVGLILIAFIVGYKQRYVNLDILEEAEQYEAEGDYIKAVDTYVSIYGFGGVQDALDRVMPKCTYQKGQQYEENEQWLDAAGEYYLVINTIDDARERYIYCIIKYLEREGFTIEESESKTIY